MKRLSVYISFSICLFIGSDNPSAEDKAEKTLVIFAASSTQNALKEITSYYSIKYKTPTPKISFGGSAIMARQIKAGAKADIFISANRNWIDFLQKSPIPQQKPEKIIYNQLVLAAPAHSTLPQLTEVSLPVLETITRNHRPALANPETAPAGQYTKKYLQSIGAWEALKNKAAYSSNVRQTLRLIEYGGLNGFIYASDAKASKGVKILYKIPHNSLAPITYYAVSLSKTAQHEQSFIDFLKSGNAVSIWEKHGFLPDASN